MSVLDRLYLEYLTAYKFLLKKWDRRFMVARDIRTRSAELAGYTHDIVSETRLRETAQGPFCLFVHYEPSGEVSANVLRILSCLDRHGVQTILLCNHGLSDTQRDLMAQHCHSFVERGNRGFDFGAYKDGVHLLREKGYSPSRLVFLNDSVFYRQAGLDTFVEGLLEDHDAVAAFENWGEGHHLQSFALSVSARVFHAKAFQTFWRDYRPVDNRIHAIESGEKMLSDAILSAAGTSKVLYSTSALFAALESADAHESLEAIHIPILWRKEMEGKLGPDEERSSALLREVIDIVSRTSPIHAGAYLFPRYLDVPLFKKDLVYRERFKFWELDHWARELLGEQEHSELLSLIRRRGDFKRLKPYDRRRYNIGVK